MDILSLFLAKLSFIWEIGIPFLVALTILVFVHELGHYAIARWCNVKVEVFSIGFGPEIKGWDDSHGTRWKISAVPLGGYVKMFGESETILEGEGEEEKERPMTPEEVAVSFHHKLFIFFAKIKESIKIVHSSSVTMCHPTGANPLGSFTAYQL